MLFKKSSNTFAFPILRADTKSQFMNLENVKMIRNAIRYVQKNYIPRALLTQSGIFA
jgi:hypothetical protein